MEGATKIVRRRGEVKNGPGDRCQKAARQTPKCSIEQKPLEKLSH
jgi:hypothetical protein